MGIPKFFSDLQPYNECVQLGATQDADIPTVSCVIVDGPSLVYCIYYRLLASSQRASLVASISYDLICSACASFLAELERSGVDV